MTDPVYGGVSDEDELPVLARLVSHAFAGPRDASAEWLREAGLDSIRVLREAGAPVASLLRIPMGQYFGGRSVPMLGIAGVAVAPEARGRGLARRLMEEALREVRDEGWPISCLYPSTQTLYRQVGYEQAGHRFMIRVPLSGIGIRERASPVVPLEDGDRPAIEACYAAFAASQDGWLDRGPYCWGRVRNQRGDVHHGFGIEGAGGLDGYVFLLQRRKPESWRHDISVSDGAFLTPAAGRRLLGFLSDFAMVGEDLVFFGGPHHPWLWLLPQQRYAISFRNYWMIRLTDVVRACEARGYAPSVRAEAHLEIADPLLPENGGRYVLRVEDGRGRLEPGGSGEVRADVRSFAALWSGFATPAQLAALGAVDGPDAALRALGAVFAGAAPAMPDMF